MKVVLASELTVISIPAGVNAEVSNNGNGTFTTQNLGGGTVTVTVDGVASTVAPGHRRRLTRVNLPTDKDQCKKDGWKAFHYGNAKFKNQGDCVSFVATGGKNFLSG